LNLWLKYVVKFYNVGPNDTNKSKIMSNSIMSTPTTQILENLFYFIYKNDSRFWTWSKYL